MSKVFVYFNLHKKVWSVKALDGERKGKVIARLPTLMIRGASFKVSEAGRQRVIREKKKYVHAGVVGYITEDSVESDKWTRVRYNPFIRGEFFTESGAAYSAQFVRLNADRTVDMIPSEGGNTQ